MRYIVLMGLPLIAVAGLGGCDQSIEEPPGIQLHEPGEYLGKTDPFLEKSGTPELENQLADRLRRVQTDR